MSKTIVRQGDVLLEPIEAIGEQFTRVPLDRDGSATLARGEVTGHRHRLEFHAAEDGSTLSTVYVHPTAPTEVARLRIEAAQNLVHEEHVQCELAPGLWRISRPYEYEGAELLRRVED
jgi:hypothetical protein